MFRPEWPAAGCPKLQSNAGNGRLSSWHHHLNPELSRERWTDQANRQLFELHKRYGSRWKEIAANYEGRTDSGIKNQFFSIIRKSLRKACKYSGLAVSPATINSIKPKILSQFLRTEGGPVGNGGGRPDGRLRMSDLILQFAFSKDCEVSQDSKRLYRGILEQGLDQLEQLKLPNQ